MNPLASLPLAVAAGGGRVDQYEAQQLVAAGLTLLQRSAALVRALSGRRAAILLPTSPQFLVALAASEGRGAVLVNALAAPAEVAHQLADANVGAVFTHTALASRVPAGIPLVLLDDAPRRARVVADGTTRDVDLGAHFGIDLSGESGVEGLDEECGIVYTSAMAGTPLGAIVTHRNLLANARATVEAMGNVAGDHSLAVLPLSHLFGLTVTAVAPLLVGGRVTTMERFHPGRAIDLIEQQGVTEFVAVPAVFAAVVSVLQRRGTPLDAPALRLCICGGAPLAVELQDRFAELTGAEMRQGYGLTETSPVALFNRVDRPNRRGTLGVPVPGVDVEIRDPATFAPVADGTAGEICIRGHGVFRGYVSAGETGLAVRDGWLCSGDRGVRHADGTVTFLGVIKPMFTRNAFNIFPRELERVIGAMPGVTAVSVRGVPDAAKEHEIVADIVAEVAGATTAADVKAWCEPRLSAYKQPGVVDVR